MISKFTGTYQGTGKFDSQLFNVNGEVKYLKFGTKYNGTPLVKEKTYELTTWQTEGKKTIYINEAKEVGSQTQQVGNTATSQPTYKASEPKFDKSKSDVNLQAEKMTKEDWAKKDQDIKWISCLKSACIFNAQRPETDIQKVISDAKELFNATTEKSVVDDIPTQGF